MSAIFISYRREDAEGHAGRLFEDLSARFGRDSVFMDVAGIEPGRDFRKVIDRKIAECDVLLAVIGRNWLDAADETGARRIDDPHDFVRLETASALKRDIPVVPVLVHGAQMPTAEQLPTDLAELSFRNAVELTHARWASDVQVLIEALTRLGIPQPGASSEAAAEPEPTHARSSADVGVSASGSTVPPAASASAAAGAHRAVPAMAMLGIGALVLAAGVWLYQGSSEPENELVDVEAAAVPGDAEPDGFTVRAVEFAAGADGQILGSFEQIGDREWVEYGADGEQRFTFREDDRDEWSVYLWDGQRNVGVQLDLHTRQVNYKDGPNAAYGPLYTIVDAR